MKSKQQKQAFKKINFKYFLNIKLTILCDKISKFQLTFAQISVHFWTKILAETGISSLAGT